MNDNFQAPFKPNGFNKQPLPLVYKKAAEALESYKKNKKPLELTLNLNKKYPRISYDLAVLALQHEEEIEYLMEAVDIFPETNCSKETVIKILVAELLWGRQILNSNCEEVRTVLNYEDDLRETFMESVIVNYKQIINKLPCQLPVYVRVNTLNNTLEHIILQFQKEGWHLLPFCKTYAEHVIKVANIGQEEFMRDFHIPEVLIFPPGTNFRNHFGLYLGNFFIQDKGSCLSSYLLNPKPHSTVLDICAGPGLKTNHIANIMKDEGKIFANDKNVDRYDKLCDLLEISNVTNTETLNEDLFDMNKCLGPDKDKVQYILIDPSCTYSGIFYKIGNADSQVRSRFQFSLIKILKWVLHSFPNVRRVVYTTCSIYAEEGEVVVDEALKDLSDSYTLLNAKEMLWNEWQSPSISGYHCSSNCLRTYPGHDGCQGYFIAVFERLPNTPIPKYIEKTNHKEEYFQSLDYSQMEEEIAKDFMKTPLSNLKAVKSPFNKKFNKPQIYNRSTPNKRFVNKGTYSRNDHNRSNNFRNEDGPNKRFKPNANSTSYPLPIRPLLQNWSGNTQPDWYNNTQPNWSNETQHNWSNESQSNYSQYH